MASNTQMANGTIHENPSIAQTKSKQYVQSNMDASVYNKKIEEVIQYILYCTLSEKRVVVKRADINKFILKDHSRAFLTVMEQVREQLSLVFGLDLVELDEDKQEKYGVKNQFQFDINVHNRAIATATNEILKEVNQADDFNLSVKYSFLMIALTLIFMNNNELDSSQLWECLKRIDLNRNEKRNPFIGDVEKFFTQELVKDGYLEYEQVAKSDPPAHKFKWGYRAKLEISKKSILNFVCEMYGGLDVIKPTDWQIQFMDAEKNDAWHENDVDGTSIHNVTSDITIQDGQ